jgi:hypothetical protein
MAAGIVVRHGKACRSREGRRCSCRPSYQAWVYLARKDRKVIKRFRSLGEARAWRTNAQSAAGSGKLRLPAPVTLQQAAAEWLELVDSGKLGNRKGEQAVDASRLPAGLGATHPAEARGRSPVGATPPRRAGRRRRADRRWVVGVERSERARSVASDFRPGGPDVIVVGPTEGLELRRLRPARQDRRTGGGRPAARGARG